MLISLCVVSAEGVTLSGHKGYAKGALEGGEDNWGRYERVNPQFGCSHDDKSTTNFWLGETYPEVEKHCGPRFFYERREGLGCKADILRVQEYRSFNENLCEAECSLNPMCMAYSLKVGDTDPPSYHVCQVDASNSSKVLCRLCKFTSPEHFNREDHTFAGLKMRHPHDYPHPSHPPVPCGPPDGCFVQAQRSEGGPGKACDHKMAPSVREADGISEQVAVHLVDVASMNRHVKNTHDPIVDILC
ncbi:unnamed protein product, partial [Vitrella brassicaformis CCMP3155]